MISPRLQRNFIRWPKKLIPKCANYIFVRNAFVARPISLTIEILTAERGVAHFGSLQRLAQRQDDRPHFSAHRGRANPAGRPRPAPRRDERLAPRARPRRTAE